MADDPHESGAPRPPSPSPGDAHALRTSEFASIARWLHSAESSGPGVLRGPGDDVAWLEAEAPLALSVDSMVEGVHFAPGWLTDREVGRKALAAALSDLAAAGARPLGCLVALSLPRSALRSRGDAVMAGLVEGAARWSCPILGGDTTGGEGLTVSVTVVGTGRVFGRSGAQPGDLVLLSGDLGHAADAVSSLTRRSTPSPRARRALADPEPRLDLREALAEATAAIDVSDGLLADAGHLAERSGVAIVLDRAACLTEGLAPEAALSGGEDYELLATAPRPLRGFRVVGRAESGAGLRFADGQPLPPRRGWDHGATS